MNEVNPYLLKIARESRGLTQTELAGLLDVTSATVSNWENGQFGLTTFILELVAKRLDYPVSFFTQRMDEEPLPLSFRKRNQGVTQKDFNQIDANARIFQLNMETLISVTNFPIHHTPVLPLETIGTPEDCARKLRKLWSVKKGAIDNLSALLEDHGIFLASFDFDTDRVDGRVLTAYDKYPLILTNKSLLGDRQRFTLAYHLGYIVMYLHTKATMSETVAHNAKLFAAEFLMPEKDITADLQDLSFETLHGLKKKWKVSMISLLHRAHTLKIITDNQKKHIQNKFNVNQINKREPKELDVPVEHYKLVRDLLTKIKLKQRTSVKEVAAKFHLNQDDFLKRYNF